MNNEAERLFKFLYCNCPDGQINLRWKFPGSDEAENIFVDVNHPEVTQQVISKNPDCHWWYGVNLRNGNNGKKSGISLVAAAHLDNDNLTQQIENEINHFPLKPSVVIQSSTPQRKQFLWKLKEPLDGKEYPLIEEINLRLINRFGGDRGTHDASRVLRLPGTRNWKYPDAPVAKILQLNEDAEYNLSDFDILPKAVLPVETEKLRIKSSFKDWEKAKAEISRYNRIMLHFLTPKPEDRSGHDWRLACLSVEHGITDPNLLYQIILNNPHGKAQHYLKTNEYITDLISRCLNQLNVTKSTEESLGFPEEVISGVAGDFANLFSQYVESPREFLCIGYLVCLGNILAGKLMFKSERPFETRYYVLLLGESAQDRKSTGLDIPTSFFKEFLDGMLNASWGVGFAEGLQARLSEVPGGRLLLLADEFKAVISKCRIEGSILLPCLNTLFEKTNYENRTKTSDVKVENGHLSILAASTKATYETLWTDQFISIGFPNRLFLVPGKAERTHPLPGKIPQVLKQEIADKTKEIVDFVGSGLEVPIDEQAYKKYEAWYFSLADAGSEHTKRLDTYCLRFMPLLALNEKKYTVDNEIVEKAIALMDWQRTVREMLDPIDATNEVAMMEEKVRRLLRKGPYSNRDLSRHTHTARVGTWVLNKALSNLSQGRLKEISFNRTIKKWQYL